MDNIMIKFTFEQAKYLQEILDDTQDEGPVRMGWASGKLLELRTIVDDAIDNFEQKNTDTRR